MKKIEGVIILKPTDELSVSPASLVSNEETTDELSVSPASLVSNEEN